MTKSIKEQTDYKNRWQRENKDRIPLVTDKGMKAEIQAAADRSGASLNGYIVQAIREKMERERNG